MIGWRVYAEHSGHKIVFKVTIYLLKMLRNFPDLPAEKQETFADEPLQACRDNV